MLNLSCGGGHLEFMIDTNNEKLANGDRMTIHVQLGCLSFIKFLASENFFFHLPIMVLCSLDDSYLKISD
jgi:hypothetical protein